MSKPADTDQPAPLELRNPLLQSFISLAIVVHFLCVAFVFSANVNASQLQRRLAGVLGPYTQLLHLDPGGARLQFTDGSEQSDDYEIVVAPKLSDGSLGEADAVRFPSDERRWSSERGRLITLARDMSAYAERDELVGFFARSIGSHVLSEKKLEHVVVRVRHRAAEPFNEDDSVPERATDYNVYEAEVWLDPELGLQMQKRASGLGAAPTTRGVEGGLVMSAVATYFQDLSRVLGEGWNRFWFSPASPVPLAPMRIAAGLIAIIYLLSWTAHQNRFLTADGLLPPEMVKQLLTEQNRHLYRPSPLFGVSDSSTLLAYNLVALAGAALFTLGAFTRISGAITLALVLGYMHRAPMLTGPTETLLVMLLLYLVIAPSAAAYSVDAYRAKRGGKNPETPSWLAGLGLRLIQVHLAGLILLVACSMLASGAWWNGTAIWALEAQTLSRPIDLSWLRKWPKVVNGWSHLFVLVNLVFPVLVWYRLWRPLVLAAAAIVWLLMIPVSGETLYILLVLTAMYAFYGTPVAESQRVETSRA